MPVTSSSWLTFASGVGIGRGLGLTDLVIAPHVDNEDVGEGCRAAADRCEADGFTVQRLTDVQALLIDGSTVRFIGPAPRS